MRKVGVLFLAVMMLIVLASCMTSQNSLAVEKADFFTVGSDIAEAVAETASAYSATYTINLRIVAEDDELFNGHVSVQSDTQMLNDYVLAAVKEKGLDFVENEQGYISQIGSYVNDNNAWVYWTLYLNGEMADFGPMSLQVRNGDFIEYRFEAYSF